MDPYGNPDQARRAVLDGFRALEDERKHRADHLAYYRGRWSGRGGDVRRPLNLIAQGVHALLPSLVPNHLRFSVTPKRQGLARQAAMLQLLVEQSMREQLAVRSIFRPGIADAIFSPTAWFYTNLRAGKKLYGIAGADYDPGEPFTQHVDFDDAATDPHARDPRERTWDAHITSPRRDRLLANPDYAKHRKLIENLPASHRPHERPNADGAADAERSDAESYQPLFERVNVLNVAVYDGSRIFEGSLPVDGEAVWLDYNEIEGPEGGPYTKLDFYTLPGTNHGIAPVAFFRDISEACDVLVRKIMDDAQDSKSVLGYKAEARDVALDIEEAEHGASVKMDDPNAARMFTFSALIADMLPVVQYLLGLWDETTGARMLNGTRISTERATGQEILAQNASAKLLSLRGCVNAAAGEIARREAYHFQTDPASVHRVPYTIPASGRVIELAYPPAQRQAEPGEFLFSYDGAGMGPQDPNLRVARLIDTIRLLGEMMPMFQAGLYRLPQTAQLMQREVDVDGFEAILGDPEVLAERIEAERGADAFYARSAGVREPGSRSLPESSQGLRQSARLSGAGGRV